MENCLPPGDDSGRCGLVIDQHFPNLEGNRICLRAPTLGDAEAIFEEYATDPEVTRYLTWTARKGLGDVAEFLHDLLERNRSGKEFNWAISRLDEDRLIGMISARITGHRVELGYVLGRSHWNQGFMSEAVTTITEWMLSEPEFYRVSAVCDTENAGSARVLEKSGFEREGILRSYMIHPNVSPQPRDCLVYGRVK